MRLPSFILKNQKGASAVEFAVILPLLVTLLFGIIEFSVLLFDKNVLTNASREGARFGIVQSPRNSVADISGVVNDYCASNLISFGAAPPPTVSVPAPCANFGDPLTVTATYPYSFLLIPSFVETLTPTINLTATTVMKCE
jgi:Flp pilus assembly protein TadG